MGRLHTFVVTLRRDSRETNWGLRLVGGADLATPLIVTRVTPGTPAGRDLVRGDIIAKIDDYDARDLRHEDAQNLFKNAPQHIKLVVQRGIPSSHLSPAPRPSGRFVSRVPTPTFYYDYAESYPSHYYTLPRPTGRFISRVPTPTFYHDFSVGGSSVHLYSVPRASGSFVGRVPTPTFYHEFAEDVDREAPAGASYAPKSPIPNSAAPPSYRTPSPLPPTQWRGSGVESLPRTPVPNHYPAQHEGEFRSMLLSPASTRTDETIDESIGSQPYRTTPLVLPGAKVRREPGPTESYLRHHPNPAMRAPPHHDYRDTLMKQKVAESVLQRVGEDGNKMVHKQFNSPINLYSDQNIANTIRQQSSPLPANGHYARPHVVKSHKPTVLYDPAKSETFRALQEEGLGDVVEEVPVPIQPKVFTAPPNKRPAPTPKPTKQPDAAPKGKQTTFVNSLHEEHIQQSNSFKRLMYNVLGE